MARLAGISQWSGSSQFLDTVVLSRYHGRNQTGPSRRDIVFGKAAVKSGVSGCIMAMLLGTGYRTLICWDSAGTIALAYLTEV